MKELKHLQMDDYYLLGHDIDYYYSDYHDHIDFYEFLFVVRGRALNVIDEDIQVVNAQNIVFIRPDDRHYIKPFSDKAAHFEFFNLRIPKDIMYKEFEKCEKLRKKIHAGKMPTVIGIGRTEFGVLCARLCEYDELKDTEIKDYLYHSILTNFLTMLLSCKPITETKMPNWFKELLDYIKTQNVATLTYDDILTNSNVEKSYLWKMFKKYLNISPTEYINILKLEKACELIMDNTMSMTEVAFEVGYNSYSYFVRQFKNRYGYAPKEFSKNNNNIQAKLSKEDN